MGDQSVFITGASSGLGAAIAREFAAPGRTLGLVARRAERLASVADDCRARGATVHIGAVDIRDRPTLGAFVSEMHARNPIDLVVANAGVFTGHAPGRRMESLQDALWQVETNICGTLTTVDAVLPAMRRRGRGRIAIVSSLAALHPLADAPAYSASKAALTSYAAALREFLAPEGIGVTIIHPGHIATDQVVHHVGALPMMMSPERAARLVQRGLERRRDEIAFPLALSLGARAARLLPWRLRMRLNAPYRFAVARGPNEGRGQVLRAADDRRPGASELR
jgi:short-subunit dehydrogenase